MNGIQSMTSGMVERLSSMGVEPLKQLFAKAMSPGGAAMNVPPLAILGAIQNAVKQQRVRQAQQSGIAQMQAQQPTVRDEVLAQAEQPVMAAHGGEMREYAGGGIVALQHGGAVQKFQSGSGPRGIMSQPPTLTSIDGIPIYVPGSDKKPGESEAEYEARKQKEAAEADEIAKRPLRRLYRAVAESVRAPSAVAQMRAPAAQQAASAAEQITDTGDELTRMLMRTPPSVPTTARDTRGAAPGPSAAPGGRRQTAPAPAQAMGAATSGLPAVLDAEAAVKALRDAEAAKKAAIERQGQMPPEILAKQQKLLELTGAQATATKQEQDRLRTQGEKRMQEALERSRTPGYQDPEVLGSILAGMAGAKRLGEGLAGAGAGAGKAMAARRKELQAAEEKFDLSKGELFRLEGLRNQVLVQQQQLDLANATGNKALADKVALDLALAKEALAKAEFDVREKAQKASLDRYQAESQRMSAEAARTQAGKPTGTVALLRELGLAPTLENLGKIAEVQQGPKTEGSMLKEIVVAAMKNPLMLSQYPPEIQALVKQEMLKLGVTSALPKGAGVRE